MKFSIKTILVITVFAALLVYIYRQNVELQRFRGRAMRAEDRVEQLLVELERSRESRDALWEEAISLNAELLMRMKRTEIIRDRRRSPVKQE